MLISSFRNGYRPLQSIPTKTFCTSNLKKITIISMGEHHADPAPHGLTRQYIEKFHALGIDQIRCEEQPQDSTHEEAIAYTNYWIAVNKKWLAMEAIADMTTRNPKLAFPYFTHAQFEKIKQVFAALMPLSDEIDHAYRANLLYRHIHLRELSLLDKLQLKLNIAHQSIDVSKEEHSKCIENSGASNDPDFIFTHEQVRINTMINNIFNKAFPKIEKNGGIIWINHGGAHLLNLTAAIFNHIFETHLYQQYSIGILPTFCTSSYVSLSPELKLAHIAKSQKYITDQKLLSTSKEMPLFLLEVTETGPHTYTCEPFNSLMDEVATSHTSRE